MCCVGRLDQKVKLEAGLCTHKNRNAILGARLRPTRLEYQRELNDDRKVPTQPLSATGSPAQTNTGASSLGPVDTISQLNYHVATETVNSFLFMEQAKTRSVKYSGSCP
jgi:hypothetical protein